MNNGKPILLTGMKGVGKTYLAYDFAKAFFEHICYINFEREPVASKLLEAQNPDLIMAQLLEHFHINPEVPMGSIVLILDEIGRSKEALYFLELQSQKPMFPYVLAISSSQIDDKFSNITKGLTVYPLDFDEFLRATSNEWYIESILTHFHNNCKIPDIVHQELLALHQLYLQIGGMPGIINEYLNLSSTVNVADQHAFLIGSYHDYIQKDYTDSDALKMNQVFDSLVFQLMKENKKFQYKLIRKGTTHSMYKEAIHKLSDLNYLIKCNRISNEELDHPVDAFSYDNVQNAIDNTNFKLYMPDTGLLHTNLVKEQGSTLNKLCQKALIENYVAQSLRAKNLPFGFWESESMAKLDFIFLKEDNLYPIEIFFGDHTRSKTISIIKQKCEFPYALKISSKNFDFSNQIKYVPYYAIFCL